MGERPPIQYTETLDKMLALLITLLTCFGLLHPSLSHIDFQLIGRLGRNDKVAKYRHSFARTKLSADRIGITCQITITRL